MNSGQCGKTHDSRTDGTIYEKELKDEKRRQGRHQGTAEVFSSSGFTLGGMVADSEALREYVPLIDKVRIIASRDDSVIHTTIGEFVRENPVFSRAKILQAIQNGTRYRTWTFDEELEEQ